MRERNQSLFNLQLLRTYTIGYRNSVPFVVADYRIRGKYLRHRGVQNLPVVWEISPISRLAKARATRAFVNSRLCNIDRSRNAVESQNDRQSTTSVPSVLRYIAGAASLIRSTGSLAHGATLLPSLSPLSRANLTNFSGTSARERDTAREKQVSRVWRPPISRADFSPPLIK